MTRKELVAALVALTDEERDEVWFEVIDATQQPLPEPPEERAEENRWTSKRWTITGIPACMGAAAMGPDHCTCPG